MYPVGPPLFIKGNNKEHHKKGKTIKRYDHMHPIPPTAHNYDLRLIILRHAERLDKTLGSDWYNKIFGGVPSAPVQAYRHPLLPQRLPTRSKTFLYIIDPPITREGENESFLKGQHLNRVGATIDYCYSSPASRSVLTANAILKGMNSSHVPICLEPYLFEPMNWNTALLTIEKLEPFMSTTDWKRTGYNVDQHYQRLNNYLNPFETETDYYHRSRDFFQSLERRHGGGYPPVSSGYAPRTRKTILIAGHASSTEIFSTIALQKPFDPIIFNEQSAKVPYLHTAVLERDSITHTWYLRKVLYFV